MAKLTNSKIEGEALLQTFYADDWFGQNDRTIVYLRYYSIPFPPEEDFYIPGIERDVLEFSGVPFRVNVSHITDLEYKDYIPWFLNVESGQPNIFIEISQRILPSARYVIVSR